MSDWVLKTPLSDHTLICCRKIIACKVPLFGVILVPIFFAFKLNTER